MVRKSWSIYQIGPAYSSNNAGDGPEKTRDHRFWFPRFKSNWLGTFRSKQMFACCECALPARATVSYRYRGSDQKHCTCGNDQWHLAKQVEEDEHDRRAEVSRFFDSARYDDIVSHLRMHTEMNEQAIEKMQAKDCLRLKVSRTLDLDAIAKNNNLQEISASMSSMNCSRALERRSSDSNLLSRFPEKRLRNDSTDDDSIQFHNLGRAASFDRADSRFVSYLEDAQEQHAPRGRETTYATWKSEAEPAGSSVAIQSSIPPEQSFSLQHTMTKSPKNQRNDRPNVYYNGNGMRIDKDHSDEHSVIEDFISTLLEEPEMKRLLAQSPRSIPSTHPNASGVRYSLSNSSAGNLSTSHHKSAPAIHQSAQQIQNLYQPYYRCTSMG